MECSHLDESVVIALASANQHLTISPTCSGASVLLRCVVGLINRLATLSNYKVPFCCICSSQKSPWMCLSCGQINCGRYVNGHALAHYEESDPKHCLCMDCENLSVFCYKCDEFIVNDSLSTALESIRKQLQRINSSTSKFNEELHNNHTKENRQVRRQGSSDSDDSEKKKLKTERSVVLIRPKTSGLRNLGNTCFMNAVLQSLSNIQSFCGYIKQLPSLEQNPPRKKPSTRRDKDGDDILLVEELRKTLIALWQGGKTAISPESLFSVIWKVVPRFRGYQQQDAHEFMRYLLDRLHTELLTLLPTVAMASNSPFIGMPRGKSTIVTAIFGGILQNEVNCLICSTESKKHDPFLDLSLDIPNHFTAKTPNPKNGETVCDLSDCLSSFTEVEQLEDTELYLCSNCKTKQRSTKKFWIRRLPNVLCLHLKRFRWNMYFRVKVDTYVSFPMSGLNMSHYVLNNLYETRNSSSNGESSEYDLAAVIVHHGSGAGSGHYTSYAIHDGCWYHFNDSTVTLCDKETVAKCKAYMLFYVRRNIRLPNYLTQKS